MTNRCLILAHCAFAKTVRSNDKLDGPMLQVLKFVSDNELNFHQLPCPETLFLGLPREPHGKSWYEKHRFREFCKGLASTQADYIKQLIDGGRDIIGVVGMTFSPSCSTEKEHPSPYRQYGIFMEELEVALNKRGITPPFISINEAWRTKMANDLSSLLTRKFDGCLSPAS